MESRTSKIIQGYRLTARELTAAVTLSARRYGLSADLIRTCTALRDRAIVEYRAHRRENP
jgi:hypothetical protein